MKGRIAGSTIITGTSAGAWAGRWMCCWGRRCGLRWR